MAPIRKPSAAMDGRRVAMDPSILDAYVENRPWNAMTGGSVGGVSLGGSVRGSRRGGSFDPYASWDGLSVDPRPFSRLDTKPLPGPGLRAAMGFNLIWWRLPDHTSVRTQV